MEFVNRSEAGRLLAHKLVQYSNQLDVIVLALPRGGVPVAFEVARALEAPMDIFLVRKLGVPGYEELAMGAIASGNVRVLNDDVVNFLGISDELIDLVAAREQRELKRREKVYRRSAPAIKVSGRTVIVVDDGLATGSTMRAAVTALKSMGAKKIVVAVPVAARETCESFQGDVDSTCVCVMTPEPFRGVGLWYRDFAQTTDEEVCELLERAKEFSHKRAA